MAGEYCEPWAVDGPSRTAADCWIADAHGRFLFATYGDEATSHYDQPATRRTVLCVNALAGVPDATLAKPDEAAQLALSVLRGQPDWGLLDKLMEDRTAEATGRPFVPRAVLVGALRDLLAHFEHSVNMGGPCWKGYVTDEAKRELEAVVKAANLEAAA